MRVTGAWVEAFTAGPAPSPADGVRRPRTVSEIREDMVCDKRMLRLLQGDVGAGKTVVGLLAMASAVEAGRQGGDDGADGNPRTPAFSSASNPWWKRRACASRSTTGRDKASARRAVLEALAAGSIDIVIGTHALFQENVIFKDLGLAVVDEQHRFGVHQRLALGAKGEAVDVLVMTATPIPRTLALAHFGDMDISVPRRKTRRAQSPSPPS